MKYKVKESCAFSNYIGRIGKAEETKAKENAMFYPDGGTPWRVVLAWNDLEEIEDVR